MKAIETPITIRTERLILRPLQFADAALIGLYTADARVARMTRTIPHPLPPGAAEAFVERVISGEEDALIRGVEHAASEQGGLIGVTGVEPDGEIGYWLGATFWSTGFATEAVEGVIADEIARGRARMTAEVFQDNPASAKVLTKAGFAYAGEGRAYSIARQAEVDVWRYRLDADAWLRR